MVSVDRIRGLSGSLAVKIPCRVATTAAITLSGVQTVDGILLAEGDRVLVRAQASSVDNGIYEVSSGTWQRAPDADGYYDLVNGTLARVNEGTTYAGVYFCVVATDPITPGTTVVTFLPDADLSSLTAAGGASLIGFMSAGTGAVARTVQDKLREAVSVKDFGAVGNGVTDDTLAISKALDAILTGGRLYFPKGTYVVSSQLVKTATGPIELYCEPGTIIDATTSTDYYGIYIAYAVSLSLTLASAAYLGQVSVALTDASAIAAGDLLLITSTDNFVDNAQEALGSGEIVEVSEVSGNNIIIPTGLADDYAAATTTIKKISGHAVTIRNMTVLRSIDNGAGISVVYGRKVLLENCKVSQARERGYSITSCYQVQINNCSNIAYFYTGVTTGYGLSITSSQQVEVNGGSYTAGRHGIAINMISGGPIARYIAIRNSTIGNDLISSATWALDSHEWAEYVTVENNIVSNGIGLQCGHAKVLGNRVYASRGIDGSGYAVMIYVWPFQDQTTCEIRGNILKQTADASTIGIRVNIEQTLDSGGAATNNAIVLKSVIIADNYVSNVGTPLEIYGWANTSGKISHLVISKNTFTDAPSSSANINIIHSTERYNKTVEYLEFTDNYVEAMLNLNHDGISTKITNNTFNGLDAMLRNNFMCTGDLFLGNNHLDGYTTLNGLYLDMKYINTVYFGANIIKDGFSPFSISKPRNAVLVGNNLRGQVSSDTSAPTYGLWTLGDIIYNSTMTASGYVGWVCTTAGYGVREAWSALTTYNLGEQATNGGNLYRCVISGVGGTGPTTTTAGRAGEEASGTATWEFISSSFTTAVFKTFGAISA